VLTPRDLLILGFVSKRPTYGHEIKQRIATTYAERWVRISQPHIYYVLEKLKKLPKVIETHLLYGPYDVYMKAEAKTTAELERLVINDIRNIKGIRSTMTCFIAD